MGEIDVERQLQALREQTMRREVRPDAWPRLERRLRREPWRRAALAMVAMAILVTAAALAPDVIVRWVKQAPVTGGPTTTVPGPSSAKGGLVVTGRIRVPRGVTDVATGAGAVWVSSFGTLTRVEPKTNRVVASIPMPGSDEDASIAIGEGAVWVTSGSQRHGVIWRVDPRTNRVVATITLPGGAFDIALAGGMVWVTQPGAGQCCVGPGFVVRIDPRTNRVAGRPVQVGSGPGPIRSGAGAVWVTNSNGGVTRLDPRSGAVTGQLGDVLNVQAIGAGALWSTAEDGVRRVDPATGRVIATIAIPDTATAAFGAGALWVVAYPPSSSSTVYEPIPGKPGKLYRVDPSSNRVVGVPASIVGIQPIAVAIGEGGVWVGDFDGGIVTRVDVAP